MQLQSRARVRFVPLPTPLLADVRTMAVPMERINFGRFLEGHRMTW